MKIYRQADKAVADYFKKSGDREFQMYAATIKGVDYFQNQGDTLPDAQEKIRQLSDEISNSKPAAKLDYIMGHTQPLKDCINASALVHMTAEAKAEILSYL